MREEGTNPEDFFKSYCLAFIGGLPYTSDKSIDGMAQLLIFENALAIRAAKDGITKEECYKRLAKKTKETPKGFARVLAYLSFFLTKEEIEQLREAQGGTFKVTRIRKKK